MVALYLRLSKEDELEEESNSITNQRFLLQKYIRDHTDLQNYTIEEYVDDGYSGKNFNRPGIQRLFQDIRKGKIYTIIVKDLSRFGRNYIEVGDYIEKIFPLLNIRFISVNNDFDLNSYALPSMNIAFQNLTYDFYSVQNSEKIKSVMSKKRSQGNYITVFAPFGYKKSENKHNQLEIDEEAATIVKLIFELYIKYGVKTEVARYLNKYHILTPQEYATKKGLKYQWKYKTETKMWNSTMIRKILSNQVYIGHLVYHKKQALEVGSRQSISIPKEEWCICENTHPAIISKELFNLVNNKEFLVKKENKKIKEKHRKGDPSSPIKGYVKCGGCKHTLTRRNRYIPTYYCRYYYQEKNYYCCSANIKEEAIVDIVLSAIHNQALLISDLKALYEEYNSYIKRQNKKAETERKSIENQIKQYEKNSFELYEKYQKGELTKADLKKQKEIMNEAIIKLRQKINDIEDKVILKEDKLNVFDAFKGKEHLQQLTRPIVEELIETIYIHNNKRIEVIFNFMDEVEKIINMTNSDLKQKIN